MKLLMTSTVILATSDGNSMEMKSNNSIFHYLACFLYWFRFVSIGVVQHCVRCCVQCCVGLSSQLHFELIWTSFRIRVERCRTKSNRLVTQSVFNTHPEYKWQFVILFRSISPPGDFNINFYHNLRNTKQ